MKKINYLSLSLSLLILGGCAQKDAPLSLATAWQEKYLNEEDTPNRKLASEGSPVQCLESNFNLTNLQKEVADYEKRVSGEPVKGFWKHINLESLPIPQANFLKKYGNSIGDLKDPESINYEGCNSLPCIFNRIYQRDEYNIAGYVHYIWYLKFGHYLSLDNLMPVFKSQVPGKYDGKEYILADYLYSDDELYGLWRLTHALQEPFTSLTNLNEMQRAPGTSTLQGYPLACALASNNGAIVLTDSCLTLTDYLGNKENGEFYRSTVHEMSHMLDFLLAKKDATARSEEDDFLEIAGYRRLEFSDDNGKVTLKWFTGGRSLPRSVSKYARETPAENFAESLALFRFKGESLKTSPNLEYSIEPLFFNWISKNYFHGETYDQLGNTSRLLKKYERSFYKDILTKVANCSSTKSTLKSKYFIQSDFTKSKISPDVLNCISFEAESISKRLTSYVQKNDIDGCKTTVVSEWLKKDNPWEPAVKKSLKNVFEMHIQGMADDPKYLIKLQDFNKTLTNRTMANQAIFECFKGNTLENMSGCYEKSVLEKSKKEALNLSFSGPQSLQIANYYLIFHPYVNVTKDLYLSYKTILSSQESLIEKETNELWQMCLKGNASDDLKPSGSLFVPRKGYLVSSVYNCLNTQLPITLKNILSVVNLDGQKITHPGEERMMNEFLAPKVNDRLFTLHEDATLEEDKNITRRFITLIPEIENDLFADLSWMTNTTDKGVIEENCENRALAQMKYLPLFHLKSEVFPSMINSAICRDIESNPKFISKMREKKEDKKEENREENKKKKKGFSPFDFLYELKDKYL